MTPDTASVEGLSIKGQIAMIFTDVQTMKTDIAVIKATSVIQKVDELEKEVDTLKSRVNVLWVFFGLATTVATAVIAPLVSKGLSL